MTATAVPCYAVIETEGQAISVLQSTAAPREKEAACLCLKQIGTTESVPVLKSLLGDRSLSIWAIDALATLPGKEASDALLAAVSTCTGTTKAAAIHALGLRRDTQALPQLTKLVSDSDTMVASAAAQALGRIGGPKAVTALREARSSASGSVRVAASDALLACADRMRASGAAKKAAAIYSDLRAATETPAVRAAAFRGVALCSSEGRAKLVVDALKGNDEIEQAMAIQLVREWPANTATISMAKGLGQAAAPVQVAVIEALAQRGDPTAATPIAELTGSENSMVRIAALRALGQLGDARHIRQLAELAAVGDAAQRGEANLALCSLHRGDIAGALVKAVDQARPEAQVELIRALANRGERSAVPRLLVWAAQAESKLALAAVRGLQQLCRDEHLAGLLGLITSAVDDTRREAAVAAYASVAARSKNPAAFSAAALKAMTDGTSKVRSALLEAAGQIGGPGVIDALRSSLNDSSAELRTTALRTMAENAGDEARADLLKLAQQSPSETDRALALQGYWRLVEAMGNRSQSERLSAVQQGLSLASSPTDQKLGLARLSELRSPAALELAQQSLRDPKVRPEAEAACLQIAMGLDFTELDRVRSTLGVLAAEAEHARVRTEAQFWVAQLELRAGYLGRWLVSGPYTEKGKNGSELFDHPFAPESEPATATWRVLQTPTSLTNYWWADLAPVASGDHRVIYLKTRVFCPSAQPVSLDIGSDDGVKVWINDELIHTNNVVRGFTAGQDKAKAALSEGWNKLLMKITQHTAGCAAAIRVRTADGSEVSGLKSEAQE